MSIGTRLREARKFRNITQSELAKSLECSRGVITNIEYDKIQPSKIVLNAIAEKLDINLEWLEFGTGDKLKHSLSKSAIILSEINELVKSFSEEEQKYLLDLIMSFKNYKDKI